MDPPEIDPHGPAVYIAPTPWHLRLKNRCLAFVGWGQRPWYHVLVRAVGMVFGLLVLFAFLAIAVGIFHKPTQVQLSYLRHQYLACSAHRITVRDVRFDTYKHVHQLLDHVSAASEKVTIDVQEQQNILRDPAWRGFDTLIKGNRNPLLQEMRTKYQQMAEDAKSLQNRALPEARKQHKLVLNQSSTVYEKAFQDVDTWFSHSEDIVCENMIMQFRLIATLWEAAAAMDRNVRNINYNYDAVNHTGNEFWHANMYSKIGESDGEQYDVYSAAKKFASPSTAQWIATARVDFEDSDKGVRNALCTMLEADENFLKRIDRVRLLLLAQMEVWHCPGWVEAQQKAQRIELIEGWMRQKHEARETLEWIKQMTDNAVGEVGHDETVRRCVPLELWRCVSWLLTACWRTMCQTRRDDVALREEL